MSDSHPPYPTHAVWQRLCCQADIGASASRTGGCCARVASSSRVRRTAKAQNFSSLWPCGAFWPLCLAVSCKESAMACGKYQDTRNEGKESTNAFCLGPKTDLHPYLTGHKYELSNISMAKLQGHVMSTFASSPMFPKRLGSESIKHSVELRFSSLS